MTDSVETAQVSIPVTDLDEENSAASTAAVHPSADQEMQQQQYQFNSPTNIGLMVDDSQTAHINQGYSPALQLESSLLNESTIDSFVQPGDGLKAALPQLESTRISSTYPPADFESEHDISKVHSEPGDPDNPFNAGFVKEDQNSGIDSGVMDSILVATTKQETSLESSVFEPETAGSHQLDTSESHKAEDVVVAERKVEHNGVDSTEEIHENLKEKDAVEDVMGTSNDSNPMDVSVEMAEEAVEAVNGDAEVPVTVIETAPVVAVAETSDLTSASMVTNGDQQVSDGASFETHKKQIVLETTIPETTTTEASVETVSEADCETTTETSVVPPMDIIAESTFEAAEGTTKNIIPELTREVVAEKPKETVQEPLIDTTLKTSRKAIPNPAVELSVDVPGEKVLEPIVETSVERPKENIPELVPETTANWTVQQDVEISTESVEGTLPEGDSIEVEAVQSVKELQVEADRNVSRVENDGSILEKITNESTCSDPEVEQLTKLPETVTEFVSKDGVRVYLVGTAHFSLESQEDVAKTILMTLPRVVMVELCVSRLNILRFDEQTILEEAQNLNMAKIRSTLKQYGAVQGALYLLFLSTSAHLTRQLGMAPGGEFRRAYNEARNVLGCRIHLGDRPIHITLHRALAALSLWQKAKLVWHLLLNRSSISPEEVERCKKKDLLEEMLEEMTGEFPALSRVFVQERDLCLAHSLQLAASDAFAEAKANNFITAPTVVGVVGIGHVAGIVNYFGSVSEADVRNVMKIPPRTRASRLLVTAIKLSLVGLVAYGCYKASPKLQTNLLSLRHAVFSR